MRRSRSSLSRSACSARLRSVMSRCVPQARTTAPFSTMPVKLFRKYLVFPYRSTSCDSESVRLNPERLKARSWSMFRGSVLTSRSLIRLPASVGHLRYKLDLPSLPLARRLLADNHPRHIMAVLAQRRANQSPGLRPPVCREVFSRQRRGFYVIGHKRAIRAHHPQSFDAQIVHAEPAHDAGGVAAGVLARNAQVLFVRLDLGVGAAVHAQIFAQHPGGGGHNVFRVGQRLQRLIQVGEETDLLLHHLALGHVAHDYREPAQSASVVMYRGDDPARPETRTVPADVPSALLIAPFGRRNLQDALRLAAIDILRRVEDRKIAPDDLTRPVPFDPLDAGVPTGHATMLVEHKNGVILDAFNQRAKALPDLPLGFDTLPEPRKDQAGEYPEYSEGNGSDLI